MHFQIIKDLNEHVRQPYRWKLVAATGTLCRSPESYSSIALARGNIAQFKRSSSGARFAKVVEPQDA